MNGFLSYVSLSLRLHFRNRMALLYGFLFPLIFLIAFWVLYRHERVFHRIVTCGSSVLSRFRIFTLHPRSSRVFGIGSSYMRNIMSYFET